MSKKAIRGSQDTDSDRLARFNEDVYYLLGSYDQKWIALRMGMTEPNFSKYINGVLPVTNKLVNRFYAAWGGELKILSLELQILDLKKDSLQILKNLEELVRQFTDFREIKNF